MKLPVAWIDVTKTEYKDIRYPALAQRKLDGELVAWNGYEGKLWNSYGRHKHWVDTKTFPKNCLLFGELYYGEGKDFYEYQRNQFSKDLKVAFFDVIEVKGNRLYGVENYFNRWEVLSVIDLHPLIPTYEVKKEKKARVVFKEQVDEGYEGIVVKPWDSLTCKSWVKLKRTYSDNLLVVGTKKHKNAILVGTKEKVYGAVSILGWQNPLEKALANVTLYTTREDKDHIYFHSGVFVEVVHNGLCSEREGKLRHPRLSRIIGTQGFLTR